MTTKSKSRKTTILRVNVEATLVLEVSNDLLPDDDWRSLFYPFHSLKDVAGHFAFNRFANGIEQINRLDGFADRPKDAIRIISEDFDIEEVVEVSKKKGR